MNTVRDKTKKRKDFISFVITVIAITGPLFFMFVMGAGIQNSAEAKEERVERLEISKAPIEAELFENIDLESTEEYRYEHKLHASNHSEITDIVSLQIAVGEDYGYDCSYVEDVESSTVTVTCKK